MASANVVREFGSARGAARGNRIALVCGRFGPDVVGGAESVIAELGTGLQQRGWRVDVLTTTARDGYSWANELPEGESTSREMRVLRFRTAPSRPSVRRRLDRMIAIGAPVALPDQYRWINSGVRVPGLYEYVFDHAADYRAIVLAPYMFWGTFACLEVAPERSLLLPCLHDEPHAQLEIFRHVFHGSRGIWFQTEPEMELAQRIFDLPARRAVIGSGIDAPARYDPEGFRARYGIDFDFALYAGRREWGKGWLDLIAHLEFANRILDEPIHLVTCGVGDPGRPPKNFRVVDLGYVSDEERSNAMAAASVYLQPSSLESFSRTINEAWLAGTPVLANASSSVVTMHCERSGAGLLYRDRFEFAESLKLLVQRPQLGRELALRGREYVLRNHRWSDVLDRVERSLEEWL